MSVVALDYNDLVADADLSADIEVSLTVLPRFLRDTLLPFLCPRRELTEFTGSAC